MATDKTVYRSSTTAPVNIAVIKSDLPHTPNPQGLSTVHASANSCTDTGEREMPLSISLLTLPSL